METQPTKRMIGSKRINQLIKSIELEAALILRAKSRAIIPI